VPGCDVRRDPDEDYRITVQTLAKIAENLDPQQIGPTDI
jgi:hypothetical protein